jgi:predicted  nucleic acid-binding Zn-ribbon protein
MLNSKLQGGSEASERVKREMEARLREKKRLEEQYLKANSDIDSLKQKKENEEYEKNLLAN